MTGVDALPTGDDEVLLPQLTVDLPLLRAPFKEGGAVWPYAGLLKNEPEPTVAGGAGRGWFNWACMHPAGGGAENPAGERSKKERGSTWVGLGCPREGVEEVEAEGPREREESAAKSSIRSNVAPGVEEEEAAATGAPSSKSKSMRLTCAAAVLAFAVESFEVKLGNGKS